MLDVRQRQREVDSILRLGIIMSIVWCMGLGSLGAFLSGLRAWWIIRRSKGQLVGMGRVWWCLTLGALGMAFWLPAGLSIFRDVLKGH